MQCGDAFDTIGFVPEESIESRRYRLLVAQMGEELGLERGWQSRVAERLGVSPSYISKIVSDDARAVGPGPIAKARDRLRLRAAFFMDEMAEEPNYQDYILVPDWGDPSMGRMVAAEDFDFDVRLERLRWKEIAEVAERVANGDEAAAAELGSMVLSTELVVKSLRLIHRSHGSEVNVVGEARSDAAAVRDTARALLLGVDVFLRARAT